MNCELLTVAKQRERSSQRDYGKLMEWWLVKREEEEEVEDPGINSDLFTR